MKYLKTSDEYYSRRTLADWFEDELKEERRGCCNLAAILLVLFGAFVVWLVLRWIALFGSL